MDKLFELSAELTLDAAAFLRGLAQAEQAARNATATLMQLQASALGSWSAVAASIRAATEQMQAFLALQGSVPASAPGFATGLDYVPYDNAPKPLAVTEAKRARPSLPAWRLPSGAAAKAAARLICPAWVKPLPVRFPA